jgi:hypothetical protein
VGGGLPQIFAVIIHAIGRIPHHQTPGPEPVKFQVIEL